jgi:hypothetical protein
MNPNGTGRTSVYEIVSGDDTKNVYQIITMRSYIGKQVLIRIPSKVKCLSKRSIDYNQTPRVRRHRRPYGKIYTTISGHKVV